MNHAAASPPRSGRLLDDAVKERLHLKGENPFSLTLIRGMIQSCDAVGRALFGTPFFALKEGEALLVRLAGLKGQDLVAALLAQEGGTEITPFGLEHIPETGPVIIAATHPLGMFDFAVHAGALFAKRPDMKVVANREVEKFLGPDIIVPVVFDKQNQVISGVYTSHAMQHHLKQGGPGGGALLIFGSGKVPDRHQGQLIEPAWRRGATQVSKASRAVIIPATMDARNSDTYYRTRAFARFLSGGNDRFGAMIASLRYAAELLQNLGGKYDVHYGAPLPPGTAPTVIKKAAETLVPGLYRSNPLP